MKLIVSVLIACCMGGCMAEDPTGEDSASQLETESVGDQPMLEDTSSGHEEVASALTTPTPLAASSSAIVFTSGTRAAEAWFNRGTPAFIDLLDAKSDAHQVYVLYKINAESEVRKTNSGGSGTVLNIPLRTGSFNIQYRVCVDIQFGTDACSGLVFDHN